MAYTYATPSLCEEALLQFAQSLEESARMLNDLAFLCQVGMSEPVVERMEAEGRKAKIRAAALRSLLVDLSRPAVPLCR